MLSEILALIAAATAGWAAHKWYLSAQVRLDLDYHPPGVTGGTARRMGTDVPQEPEPANSEIQQQYQILAAWEAMRLASELNRQAALWTAASVGATALSALAGLGG